VPFLLAIIVLMFVIPVPAFLLDIFITLNFTLALLVLLITMFTLEPLHFSIFPTLLLFTTVYRLAINVSATRLIL
jgi:flagellar biosynthesis protein FlhA